MQLYSTPEVCPNLYKLIQVAIIISISPVIPATYEKSFSSMHHCIGTNRVELGGGLSPSLEKTNDLTT
jgi:hypothetical protein